MRGALDGRWNRPLVNLGVRGVFGCILALAVCAATAVADASAAPPGGRAARSAGFAIYTVKVGISGRATQNGRWNCQGQPCNWGGGVATEAYQATFHIDETFKNVVIPVGKQRFSVPEIGTEASTHVVNGSYQESGTYDPNADGNLVSFSCGGRLTDSAAEGTAYNLTGHPRGSSWAFTADTLQYGLKGTIPHGPSGSPCDGQASFVDGKSSSFGAPTWRASFVLGKSAVGQRTITKPVSGPPVRYRPPSDCSDEGGGSGGTCTFSLSWHGFVTFKRVR